MDTICWMTTIFSSKKPSGCKSKRPELHKNQKKNCPPYGLQNTSLNMSETTISLIVPDIGDAGRIELIGWSVTSGDLVRAGEEICELVTDKAAFPLEAPCNGRILAICKNSGSLVRVGEELATLEKEG